VTPLPQPELLGCYSDPGFTPPLAAMHLRWPDGLGNTWQSWRLPRGEPLFATLPRRFGLLIRRQDDDAYAVSLVWDSTCRQWFALRRREILGSDIQPILAALGTPLDYLLEQPVGPPDRPIPAAA
jgi:hypothetical protein